MSLFIKYNTPFDDAGYLTKALKNLGYPPEKGGDLRGHAESRTLVDLRFRPAPNSFQVGFRKEGKRYVCVADWFGVRGIQQQKFMETLTLEYARVAVGRLKTGPAASSFRHVEAGGAWKSRTRSSANPTAHADGAIVKLI
jgi:hypothetical protein